MITQTWQSQANLSFFLGLLVISIFVLPAISAKPATIRLVSDIVGSIMVMAGVAIGWGRRPLLIAGLAVGVPTLLVRWLEYLVPGRINPVWDEAWTIATVLVIGYILLAQVFRDGPINFVRVQGAVAAYLLLGVAYAHAYQISEYLNSASVTSTEGPLNSLADWLYYSFATLSTLGYGDIIPTSKVSRLLAIGEAISGQLFLAILIARLVGMAVSEAGVSGHSGHREA
ncbi:MAG TPA: potassium channel family protein [Candidatus Acidoferrum sp.]|nr:potassium channel family protein [Candidatus Acidoferrum sp.]